MMGEDLVLTQDEVFDVLNGYFRTRVLSEEDVISALTSGATTVPSSSRFPAPTATTLPSEGFSFAESGMMIDPFFSVVFSTS